MASLGEGGLPAPGVTILGWYHIMVWNRNSTDLWWIPFFFCFVWSLSSFRPKTLSFCGEFLFGFGLPFLDRKRVPPRNPLLGATILGNATAIRSFCGGPQSYVVWKSCTCAVSPYFLKSAVSLQKVAVNCCWKMKFSGAKIFFFGKWLVLRNAHKAKSEPWFAHLLSCFLNFR